MPQAKIIPMASIGAAITQFKNPPDIIQGITSSDPFGPLQPVRPWLDIDEPRGLQFVPGQNLIFTPRANRRYSALELKVLSSFPMVRVLIENVKDMVCRMPWQIRPRPQEGESSKSLGKRRAGDKTVAMLTRFFEHPNPSENWSQFIRRPLEDMLVTDAPAILLRRSKKNQIVELRGIQGDLFNVLIDSQGFTPQPPDPAYQQLWFGQPMINLTTDQLLYMPRNVLPDQLYGLGPVEQSAPWIEVAAYRLEWQTNFYRAGSIPERVMVVPPGIPPEKIAEQQMWMNSALAGNLWKRRQLMLIQGFRADGHDQFIDSKEGALSDPYDDYLIRVLCYAFGTSPQRLLKMQNRATATANQDAAEDEGLQPWLDWVKSVVDCIVQQKMGFEDYEFVFQPPTENDIDKQAKIDQSDVQAGIRTRNEVREDRGIDPIESPEMEEPGMLTQNGFIPITGGVISNGASLSGSKTGPVGSLVPEPQEPEPDDTPPSGGGKQPKAKDKKKPADSKKAAHCRAHNDFTDGCNGCMTADLNKMFKSSGITKSLHGKPKIDPKYTTAKIAKAKSELESSVRSMFGKQREKAAEAAGRLTKVRKAEGDDPDKFADEIFKEIEKEFLELPAQTIGSLRESALEGAAKGLADFAIQDSDLISRVNAGARDWAENRAAEMVGKKYDAEGSLIDNPQAEWVISDTTRDDIQRIVKDAFSDESKMSDIQESIRSAGAFSDYRAEMIARTEIASAQTNANYEAWRETGVVEEVTWELSEEHSIPCECEDNENESVPFGEAFPSGDLMPPAHPMCLCSVYSSKVQGVEEV